ncbi:MAG: hypothetical protein D6705_14390 [Deltaproteobacteria bacterium]|nr:MAG: hypothetical protein D6705_14390 [Deltaproteobacteria bacterium]
MAAATACTGGGAAEPMLSVGSANTGATATSTTASGGTGTGTGSGMGSDTSVLLPDAGSEPFTCEPVPAASPVLDAEFIFDPAEPHPGDTLTVIVRAGNGLGRTEAPPMTLEVTSALGITPYEPQTIEGGTALYYYAVPEVPEGDLCLRTTIDGALEASAKIAVTPRPEGYPVDGGVYKVVTHHQWTCDEQPTFGNEVHVEVRDENGVGIPGAVVQVRPSDATDPATIYNGDAEPIPATVTTDAQGKAMFFDYWPTSEHGLLVFELRVAGKASDIATEITTGWWEDDLMGCSFCPPGSSKNVWGHWSHTIVFQRDPMATEACRVPTDHAGMSACTVRHIHHHPDFPDCWPAGLAP